MSIEKKCNRTSASAHRPSGEPTHVEAEQMETDAIEIYLTERWDYGNWEDDEHEIMWEYATSSWCDLSDEERGPYIRKAQAAALGEAAK